MSLVDEQCTEVNQLQKVLEDADLNAVGIAKDIIGKSGRALTGSVRGLTPEMHRTIVAFKPV